MSMAAVSSPEPGAANAASRQSAKRMSFTRDFAYRQRVWDMRWSPVQERRFRGHSERRYGRCEEFSKTRNQSHEVALRAGPERYATTARGLNIWLLQVQSRCPSQGPPTPRSAPHSTASASTPSPSPRAWSARGR
jgi:hypothetical protein